MKTKILCGLSGLLLGCHLAGAQTNAPIPMNQIGTRASADYKGEGLCVTATSEGARLRCVFQRLEGNATRDGLWLTSTVTNTAPDRFRVVAAAVGRGDAAPERGYSCPPSSAPAPRRTGMSALLSATGAVEVAGNLIRFSRPGLTEEYSASVGGVRQDFVLLERPQGAGPLRVELEVTGAGVESGPNDARLILDGSGRKIAYSRLRATDVQGRELPARMEVAEASKALSRKQKAETVLAVVVDDSQAAYPVRIDPTFSDANWISMGGINGTDYWVDVAVVDGSGNLYIGGRFTLAGDVVANRIAKWDGGAWSALGSGMSSNVYALAVSGSNVYAGGVFTNAGGTAANRIAKWDGSAWSALGSGMSSNVYALAVLGSNLYAGGDFTTAGGSAANGIAKWNGNAWSALGSGVGGAPPGYAPAVYALVVSGSDVYAGGLFTNAGGGAANYIAKWNGSAWNALGSGVGGIPYPYVSALAVSGSDMYAGGAFNTAGGSAANNVAKWNGSAWSALGLGVSYDVSALAVSGSEVYVAGWFGSAGGNVATYIAKWNGSAWSALAAGMNYPVSALAVSGSNVYAGGHFTTAGGSAANYVAKWNGSAWSALGAGTSGPDLNAHVSALAVSGSNVYAGGLFTRAGDSGANCVAKWTDGSWSSLGSGMGGIPYPYVSALAVSGSDVYAGGAFTTAGGVAATNIAKWTGSSWSSLGSGMGGVYYAYVYALAVAGSNVYAGGLFTTAGGISANYIAKWNGSAWSALGSGVGGAPPGYVPAVYALVVSGSDVYAGGLFTTAGGISANYIAKWNGSAWSALGSGVGGAPPGYVPAVYALVVSRSDVYAGGHFTTAGGSAANYVAKWNGSAWSALGAGMSGPDLSAHVFALAVSGSDVYAGGAFTTAGGTTANHIAWWNGRAWSALGSGMDGPVGALAFSGSDLYAGGWFTTAGGKVSVNAAKAIAIPGNWLRLDRDVPGPNTNSLSFVGVPGQSYTIQFTTNLHTALWLPLVTTNADSNGRGILQDADANAASRFYRVTSP